MRMSDQINELATALAKAQGQIEDAQKGSINPAFRSKYADMSAVREAVRMPLSQNCIAVIQLPRLNDTSVEVETMLVHSSGQFIAETLAIPLNKRDAHGTGSALSYGRRYGLMSLLCLASDDDDGNAAVAPLQAPAKLTQDFKLMDSARLAAGGGTETLTVWWKSLSKEDRARFDPNEIAELKKAASKIVVGDSV